MINERDRCKACQGKKVTQETKILEVHVDKGMKEGQKIPFRGEGDQTPDLEPGDVIIVLQQKEHDTYTRRGDDLLCTYNLGITEALCGFHFTMKALDGRDLLIKCPPGNVIAPGTTRCVEGEGMPFYRDSIQRGDLIVKFDITFPPNKFAECKQLETLETLLPPRQKCDTPEGEHVEEVMLSDLDPTRPAGGRRGEAYDDDEEDEESGFRRVQCAHQ